MADAVDIVHLLVEAGPDKGRRITVPDAGARIGRSSQNDIELTDPSISRFQCRVFFKPDGLLWIADLGSTNESLVNFKPVLESKLNVGDTIDIGETVIRVLTDNLRGLPSATQPAQSPRADAPMPAGDPVATPPATFAPLDFGRGTPQPEAPVRSEFDLGLDRDKGAGAASRAMGAKKWMWLLLVLGATVGLAAVFKAGWKPAQRTHTGGATGADVFSIYYEKVNGSVSNIFRYELTLENGKLSVHVDSLTENRHAARDKQVAKDVLAKFRDDLERSGFFSLDENYQGLQPNMYDAADLDITAGARGHHTVVLNRVEPEEFKRTREMIEQFSKDELGLITISLAPEKLLDLARDASLQGQKLYGEREVKYENLWGAIRAFDEAQIYLETIEPKPDFYPTITDGISACRTELKKQHDNYQFLADKSIRMGDWKTAAENLRIIEQLIPERSDPRNMEADKKLLDVERRIKR